MLEENKMSLLHQRIVQQHIGQMEKNHQRMYSMEGK
jgi:hypothetical protein